MRLNATRAKLKSGEGAVLGCFLRHPDSALAEFLSLRGFDFVVFDAEHGPLSPLDCENLARAVEINATTPGVRVPENAAADVMRYLDAGSLICHIPGIDSALDATEAVRHVKFAPEGHRGLSAARSSGYGTSDYGAYVSAANRETLVVVHVESRAGVAAAAEIAAIDGVDVLLFGALDLSSDLGIPGQVRSPEVKDAAVRVAEAAAWSQKTLGAVVGDPSEIGPWADLGARYFIITLEALMAPGLSAFLAVERQL